ncbi:single-stranded-DNA-specific exonuclease RecJ [Desulfosarcina sp.]|uniref:single-stranded-DNA-specific exonuclease RecJ n=1 Tax=Desulfosarcina sp. TaxID=2027861 RepID=UPI003563D2C0
MEKQWQTINPDPETLRRLSHQVKCSPLVARLLAIRGIESKIQATRFLQPSLSDLTPPMELAGMNEAVERIHRALTAGEKILVFGDYDADGITATAALVGFLRHCGARASYYIPHRIADGYGLGADFINNRAIPAGVGLIITADCGSASSEAVSLARQAGIHTIVTDHHPMTRIPLDAIAVVNPTRPECRANLAHLAGVGVAFYLIIALRAHLRKSGFWKNRREPNLKQLCDLVAVGTIADVAPLIAENRALAIAGLRQINQGVRPGIAALIRLSGSPDAPTDAEAVAFRLAPRLNAAGRLAHARMACELLLTDNTQKAGRLAKALCRLNNRRQSMEQDLLETILAGLPRLPGQMAQPALVVDGHRWHEGILGIVAARLVRRYHRPAVVISTHNGMGRGSARSIEGVDLTAVLKRCADLLDRFGGHPLAAGLSLPTASVSAFRSRLETVVGEMTTGLDAGPRLSIDAHVPLETITPELMNSLARLEPFGQGNPYPLFMDTGVRVHASKTVGDRHRQMVLEDGSGNGGRHPAIQFNVPGISLGVDRFRKIAYRPQWNYWNGRKRLQLIVEATDPGS